MRLCRTEIDLMGTHQDEKPLLGSQNSSLKCRKHLNLSFKICRVLLIGIGTLIFNQCNMGSSPIPGTKCGCGVMVATLDSESSGRKAIWVRVPSSTHILGDHLIELGYHSDTVEIRVQVPASQQKKVL